MNPTGDECSMKGLASKKKELRQEMLRSRRQLPEIQRKSHSENIFSELTKDERLREFQFVHCFVGQSDEPDTLPILEWMLNQGKKVAVPCVDSDKVELQHSLILSTDVLEIGKFGILDVRPEKRIEVNISDLDLVLVPGIAFDLS
ncbi:MAG: 5-formyltetrahydrofolate cyclo-ligase, partial [SAR324 cluster bacterium]|nr:5-formyltetrahydrofolate cyclo-ligase [SAR324 cluster bacterium]